MDSEISNISNAKILKDKGNEKFRLKEYQGALDLYDKAIEENPTDAVLYSNRAACHYCLKSFYNVLEDCDKGIRLDPNFTKLYYRRALACQELSRYHQAISDLRRILELEPENNVASQRLKKLEDILADNTRIDLQIFPKPSKYQSEKPMESFPLNKQYTGSKVYSL